MGNCEYSEKSGCAIKGYMKVAMDNLNSGCTAGKTKEACAAIVKVDGNAGDCTWMTKFKTKNQNGACLDGAGATFWNSAPALAIHNCEQIETQDACTTTTTTTTAANTDAAQVLVTWQLPIVVAAAVFALQIW